MSDSIIDERSESGIPWTSRTSWQGANQAVGYHLQRYRTELKQLAIFAREIKSCLNSVFPILDALCAHSCPWCPEPCCLKASVWYDFKDLLFLNFNKQTIPPAQPKAKLSMPCRYLGSRGCRLPRLTRPWICTWYLCPTQTAKLRNGHQAKHKLLNRAMAQIKSERNLLENEFIRIIL
jgi:hypothetical protein